MSFSTALPTPASGNAMETKIESTITGSIEDMFKVFREPTEALNECFSLCQRLCNQQPNYATQIIDVMASRLTGIDVGELFLGDAKRHLFHYKTQDSQDEYSSGWTRFYYLPLLIRNYFRILFFLVKKDFQQLFVPEYARQLVSDSNLYDRIVSEIKNEIFIALDCLQIARRSTRVQSIYDEKERNIERTKLAEELTNRALASEENAGILVAGGWAGHCVYTFLNKMRHRETNNLCVAPIVYNKGSGVSIEYPKEHLSLGGDEHHASLTANNKKFIFPRMIGFAFENEREKLKNYILGLLISDKDSDKLYALGEIHDYLQHLNPPPKMSACSPTESQSRGNCVTYNYLAAQKDRVSKLCRQWLFENELMLLQTEMKPEDRRIQTMLAPFKDLSPVMGVFHQLLMMTRGNMVKLLDTFQLKTIFDLLQDKKLLREDQGWAEDVNRCVRAFRQCKTIDFEICELKDVHIKPLIQVLRFLPHIKHLDIGRVKISEQSSKDLVSFINGPDCHLRFILCEDSAMPNGVKEVIDRTLKRKRFNSSPRLFDVSNTSQPRHGAKRKAEDDLQHDVAKKAK